MEKHIEAKIKGTFFSSPVDCSFDYFYFVYGCQYIEALYFDMLFD